jgi:predicted GH43/DUF377 family glycosyl hydrolase
MWYWGRSDVILPRIGHATSADGTHWVKHDEPVLRAEPADIPDAWPDVWVVPDSVLIGRDAGGGKVYRMWYTVSWLAGALEPAEIHYATSRDGIHWTKQGPVRWLGDAEDWERVAVGEAAVVLVGDTYRMWYMGNGETGAMDEVWRIGYAVSDDGLVWRRYKENPVLPLGPPGAWDSRITECPAVVFDEEEGFYRMWYDAFDTSGIGCATSWVPRFRRGDCNDDGNVDISDAVCILNWLFLGGETPGCVAVTNTNGDAGADLSDAVYLLGHLFLGGPAPVAPFPDCGSGLLLADEELGCGAAPAGCR